MKSWINVKLLDIEILSRFQKKITKIFMIISKVDTKGELAHKKREMFGSSIV